MPFYEEQDNTLNIVVGGDRPPIADDYDAFVKQLGEDGYGELRINKKAIIDAIAYAKTKPTEEQLFAVAERIDAKGEVKVADDEHEAFLIVHPAEGGKALSIDAACHLLRDAGVRAKLDMRAVETAVTQATGKPVLVCSAILPVDGEDGHMYLKIHLPDGAKPRIDDRGRANLRELGLFVNVKPGEALAEIVPPQPGKPGATVTGIVIPARDGKPLKFTPGEGTEFDPKRSTRIIANVAGRPVFTPDSVYIDPNLEIRNVDVSTGNVKFRGDVHIKGDVKSGYIVEATGHVHIGGTVEGAVIKAGGSVFVHGGVMGNKEVRLESGELNPQCSRLSAKGSIEASFVNNALLTAGKDILIKDSATHSELNAKGSIVIGESPTKRGQLIGGLAKADHSVTVNLLGSKANVKTHIVVASDIADRVTRFEQVSAEYVKKREETEKLARVEERMRHEPQLATAEIQEKQGRAQLKILREFNAIAQEYFQLEEETRGAADCKVEVLRTVFGNCTVEIAGRRYNSTVPEGPSRFWLEGNVLAKEFIT